MPHLVSSLRQRAITWLTLLLAGLPMVLANPARAGEPPVAPILRIDAGEHTSTIRGIATDEAGRYLVTASGDKTARVWDLRDGHLLTTLRPPIGNGAEGSLYAVALSPDGQTVALGGWTHFNNGINAMAGDGGNIYLFDRVSGRLSRRISGMSDVVGSLAFSPDGRILALTLGRGGLRLFSVADGRLIAEDRDYGTGNSSVQFAPGTNNTPTVNGAGKWQGALVTSADDGLLRLYRLDGGKLTLIVKRAAPGGLQPYNARFSPDGQRIAVGFVDTPAVNVLDGHDLSLNFSPDTSDVDESLAILSWSRDGAVLFAAGRARKSTDGKIYVRRWTERGAGAAQDWPVSSSTLTSLATLPDGQLVFASAEPNWGTVNVQGALTMLHAAVVADFRNNKAGFALSRDGGLVRFSYFSLSKRNPAVFDSLHRSFLSPDTPDLAAPRTEAPGLVVTDWNANFAPKLNGIALKLSPNEYSQSLAVLPGDDGFALGTNWYLRSFDRNGTQRWQQSTPSIAWAVNASQDGRWVVAAYGDGTIRWHRASDGVEQLALFLHADQKRWVMWSPSGYYDAAPGAEELIGWHVNRGKDQAADFFPASRFRGQFYRPDVLAKLLETRDETEALRLANAESGRRTQVSSITQVLPPVVEIVSPADGTAVATPTLTLKYNTRSPNDAPVTGLRVRVNGQAVALPEARNLTVVGAGAAARQLSIPIPAQDSEIQVFAENKNGVSTPALLRVVWKGTAPVRDEAAFKPKLYVLAVGVSKYANPDYNLGLAAKDANDFAAALQQQKGRLYRDVEVKLITDAKATKDDVLDGLDWLKRQVTARDVGMMFLAGHGMNDNTGKYFFMPHNADPEKLLRTGVPQSDIKDTLNSLAGKAVFFVDTCHAGNALGTAKTRGMGSVTDAFVNELAAAENGVVVFAASTGRQLSQENPAWGNGAFTKAVVEGLNGKADFQKSGKITHKGLDYYVSERVKDLTKGTQSPVSIAPDGVTDFPIALVR